MLPAHKLHNYAIALVKLAVVLLTTNLASLAAPLLPVKPPPSWVEPTSLDTNSKALVDEALGGILCLLADQQYRVIGPDSHRYYRRVKRVLSAAGLEDVSQIQIDFEPSYQQLLFHHMRIIRGGVTIDALKPREIKIIQQESELDEQLYNGTLTAVVFLNDVRVGDIVDYAFSVNGSNPVLGGRFASTFSLSFSEPVQRLQTRLLWPANRLLQWKSRNTDIQPAIRSVQNETEYRWQRDNVAALDLEDWIPRWFDPYPVIQLSEFGSWGDVVNWALPLYEAKPTLSAELTKQVEHWKSESGAEQRLLAATRFVQDEIRYLGIEMGPYSHLPKGPSIVFQKRFGDCKDKSFLLSVVLNKLGIEAYPALVDTDALHTLDEWQPSPLAFDHVIVQARVDGRVYWIDPTISLQRGSLSEHRDPNYRRALLVRQGSQALEEIPQSPNDVATISIEETYDIESYTSPASYQVRTTYRGEEADSIRGSLADQPLAERARSYLNYYSESYPAIESLGPLQVEDDSGRNTIVITERYKIPDLWTKNSVVFEADRIVQELDKPDISRRSMPLDVTHPLHVGQSILITMPESLGKKQQAGTLENGVVRFKYNLEQSGRTIKLVYAFMSLRDNVETSQVAGHLKLLDRIRNTLRYEVSRDDRELSWAATLVLVLITVPILALLAAKGVKNAYAKKRRVQFKGKLRQAPGGGPDAPISVTDESEIGRHLKGFRCACGSAYYDSGEPLPRQQGGMLDGRRLIVVALQCKSCKNPEDVYFVGAQLESG